MQIGAVITDLTGGGLVSKRTRGVNLRITKYLADGAEDPAPNPNLLDCPDCGNPVSRLAVACPSCGRPIAAR